MLVAPDQTVRVAASEVTVLKLDTELSISKAALHPVLGGARGLSVSGNAVTLPTMKAPDACELLWFVGDEPAFTTRVEVVSRHYFKLDALRSYGDGQDDFGSMPEEELYEARQAATEVFERNAHRSFVRRVGATVDYGGAGTSCIALDHNDVVEMLTPRYTLVSDSQAVRYKDSPHPTECEYVYGTGEVPAQVSRAVLELAAYMLRPSNRPIGATGESTDAGFIRFTTAGKDGYTDIPEVNAAIEQFGRGGERPVVTAFKAARDELSRRVERLSEMWGELYPGVQAPRPFTGFPLSEPPFYIAVDSMVDAAATDARAVPGSGQLTFTLHVMCFARHSDASVASDTLLSYVDAVFGAVMADRTLRRSVDTATPEVEASGASPDSAKYHMAAASVAVRCTVFARCPKRFTEVVS